MSGDWRLLLSRALGGDELSGDEARALADALGSEAGGREAADWLCFDTALRARLAPPGVAVSRERLLAKAALREKALGQRPLPRRRRVWRVAAAAVLAVLAGWLLTRPGYPAPQAFGAYELIRGGKAAGGAWSLRRGDTLVARAGGARLRLGGYCEVALAPDATVVVRGEPGAEAVELRRGKATSHVTPERGRFTLLTPLGSLEVKGTEFITTVESPDGKEGEPVMGRARKIVVTVMVVAGAVAFQFGDAVGVLGPGASQAFAGDAKPPGVPEALKGFKGMLVGTIAAKGAEEFVIKVEKITRTWKANRAENPQAAVGQQAVCELWPKGRLYEKHKATLAGLKVGDRVLCEPFHLEPEHDHLTVVEELKKVEEAPEPDPEPGQPGVPAALRGFQGMLVGTIVDKGAEELVIKIEKITRTWKANKAENPQAAVGQQALCKLWPKGRLYEKHKATLAELKVGDRVLVEPFHLEPEHNYLTVAEELRKAE